MSKLDSVWETHDFVIRKLTDNEDKYNMLLGSLPSYISLFQSGELSKTELLDAITNARKLISALKSLYDKHLFTIKEIRILIDDGDVPKEREVTVEVIDELEQSTHELLHSMEESKQLLDFIEEEHGLSY